MSVVIGYLLAFANLVVVILMTTDKLKIYLDFHSFICVMGGTALVSIVGFGGKSILRMAKIFKIAVTKKDPHTDVLIQEIVKIAKETKGDITSNFASGYKTSFPFLKDAIGLIADGFSKEQLDIILKERIDATVGRYKDDEKMVRTLAKLPPSFGLMGTTVGLIALFAEVGGADAMNKIGPALAVALSATFYGVVTAFLVLNPLVDRLTVMTAHENHMRYLVYKGAILLRQKASPLFIEEVLKSHLDVKGQQKAIVARDAAA